MPVMRFGLLLRQRDLHMRAFWAWELTFSPWDHRRGVEHCGSLERELRRDPLALFRMPGGSAKTGSDDFPYVFGSIAIRISGQVWLSVIVIVVVFVVV